MTFTILQDIASNFWIMIPLGLILFILAAIYGDIKHEKDKDGRWRDH